MTLICATAGGGALAVSSSVQLNGISYGVRDLNPNDGVKAAVVFAPTFDYYSEQQAIDVSGQSGFDFYEMFRCPCPILVNDAKITRADDGGVAGRTFGPDSAYLHQVGNARGFFGVTPGTEVTVSVTAGFFATPGAAAGLELKLVGYSLFPDRFDSQGSIARDDWTGSSDGLVAASFVNTGDRLAPFHFAYRMDVSGSSPPIPEPETWALMALGLAALGWQSRRRVIRR